LGAQIFPILRPLTLGTALALGLSLTGCSLVGSSAPPQPKKTSQSALSALVPNYGGTLTATNAKSVTVKTADAIQALIATTDVVHVDDHSKLVAASSSTGAFYGVERAISTSKTFDAIDQAGAMDKLLVAAGWVSRASTTATTTYTVQLTTATSVGTSALFLEADTTLGATPVILIEIESPDLPKK
jgi:hypothetical protein